MRKPAHLEQVGGKTPRQRMWEVMRRTGVFTARKVRGELTHAPNLESVRDYIKALENGGYIASTLDGDDKPAYVLIHDVGVEAPRVKEDGSPVTAGLGQEQMWRTLKILGYAVTPRALAMHASTPQALVTESAAADYCKHLCKAGYLWREDMPNRKVKYGLISARYTGPRPPQIQRVKQVYDPNTGTVVWSSKGADA